MHFRPQAKIEEITSLRTGDVICHRHITTGFRISPVFCKNKRHPKGCLCFWRSRRDSLAFSPLGGAKIEVAANICAGGCNSPQGCCDRTSNPSSDDSAKSKGRPFRRPYFWRSRRDSNSRAAFGDYTISSRARYDHFDTTPYSLSLNQQH